MSAMMMLSVLARWTHILAAVVALGGTFYVRCILMPAVQASLTDQQHQVLREAILRRWRMAIMVCIALLLLSGLYNFMTIALPTAAKTSLYHPLFGVKLLAALGVFFVASVLTGRSAFALRARSNAGPWLTINLVLALIVILVSGVLRSLSISG